MSKLQNFTSLSFYYGKSFLADMTLVAGFFAVSGYAIHQAYSTV